MRTCHFKSNIFLPSSREEIFRFFSDARNLDTLTPPWLHFKIVTPAPLEMRTGTVLDYRLRLHGLPLRWQSEITAWQPPHRFVDEQRRGPYRLWIHEHNFVARNGGTLVEDKIEYATIGGRWIQKLLVLPDLERIFAFRRRKLTEIFG